MTTTTINNTKAAFAAFCVGAALLLALPGAVFAQTDTSTTTKAAETATQTVPLATEVYEVTTLDDTTPFGDFVVGPGKFDLSLAPGEQETVFITVTNRTDVEKVFTLTTEDMTGSYDPETATVLLGEDRGPYTIKDYLSVPVERFVIAPAQKVTVPITAALPADAEPGGRYGSLLVQTTTKQDETTSNVPAAAVVSRIAVQFFVTTPGALERSGELADFTLVPDQSLVSNSPLTFGLLYENTGTVHTNPAGEISVTNFLGKEVAYIEVLPWFALPQSLRLREVTWERSGLFGYYTATANIYRGYGDAYDTKTVSFWFVNWRLVGVIFVSVLAVLFVLRFVSSRFTISRRDS